MIPPKHVLQRQADDFEKYLPAWRDDEITAFAEQHGEIVSVTVKAALPHGTVLKLASKTNSFGPMLLTPIAASNLLRALAEIAPQIHLGGRARR
jgi:hypothetical protein